MLRRLRSWRVVLAVAVLGVLASPAAAGLVRGDTGQGSGVVVRRDVAYGSVHGHQLLLDAYLPQGHGRARAAVIFVHGGGWRGGDKKAFTPGEPLFEPTATELVRLGWVVFSVDYRLAPLATFPAAADDVTRAVHWVRDHARSFGVAPARIGLFGASAGGNLAALVGTMGRGPLDAGSRVRAVVSWSGPMDLALFVRQVRPRTKQMTEDYLGCPAATCPARYRQASPTSYVDSSDPPTLIVNGSRELVPLAQAQRMAHALAAARVPYSLLVIPGSRHAANYLRAALAPTIRFLRRYLGP